MGEEKYENRYYEFRNSEFPYREILKVPLAAASNIFDEPTPDNCYPGVVPRTSMLITEPAVFSPDSFMTYCGTWAVIKTSSGISVPVRCLNLIPF